MQKYFFYSSFFHIDKFDILYYYFFFLPQSKLATMSNDFKQVLEVRTEVCIYYFLIIEYFTYMYEFILTVNQFHSVFNQYKVTFCSQNLKHQKTRRDQFSESPSMSNTTYSNHSKAICCNVCEKCLHTHIHVFSEFSFQLSFLPLLFLISEYK